MDTICPVCKQHYFGEPDDYAICPVCGWENDGVQRDKRDLWGGANGLSVNEANAVYRLLSNEATKNKATEAMDRFKRRNKEIHAQYRNIDHRTAKGEECHMAFAKAHHDLVTELDILLRLLP
jgi:uncharacterized Zn finger protein (UPF0148 family)